MHSLSFLNSGRNGKIHAVFTAGLTTIEGEDKGYTPLHLSTDFMGCCYQQKEQPNPSNLQLNYLQIRQSRLRNPWLLTQLALQSFLCWKRDAERLEELVRMIKKEREWERSTWAVLKDEVGLYKVTVHFICRRNAGRNRQASRTCSLLVHHFSEHAEDNRDALCKYQWQLDIRNSPITKVWREQLEMLFPWTLWKAVVTCVHCILTCTIRTGMV